MFGKSGKLDLVGGSPLVFLSLSPAFTNRHQVFSRSRSHSQTGLTVTRGRSLPLTVTAKVKVGLLQKDGQ